MKSINKQTSKLMSSSSPVFIYTTIDFTYYIMYSERLNVFNSFKQFGPHPAKDGPILIVSSLAVDMNYGFVWFCLAMLLGLCFVIVF